MSFKDMVEADNLGVFLDPEFFGEKRNVRYDGTTYQEVPCLLTQLLMSRLRNALIRGS